MGVGDGKSYRKIIYLRYLLRKGQRFLESLRNAGILGLMCYNDSSNRKLNQLGIAMYGSILTTKMDD